MDEILSGALDEARSALYRAEIAAEWGKTNRVMLGLGDCYRAWHQAEARIVKQARDEGFSWARIGLALHKNPETLRRNYGGGVVTV